MSDEKAGEPQTQQGGDFPPPPAYSELGNVPTYPTLPPTQPAYPPNTIAYAPPPGGAAMNVQNVVISRPAFGPFPVEMDCPYCQAHVVTSTQHIPGALPWIIFAICFVLGFFLLVPWCLCCIPFCVDSCLDVQHDCPSCKRTLGRYSRM